MHNQSELQSMYKTIHRSDLFLIYSRNFLYLKYNPFDMDLKKAQIDNLNNLV